MYKQQYSRTYRLPDVKRISKTYLKFKNLERIDCFMKEQFTVYQARNGSKYIQTKNNRMAYTIVNVTGIEFYKLGIEGELVFSFQYSNELMKAIEIMDNLRLN